LYADIDKEHFMGMILLRF